MANYLTYNQRLVLRAIIDDPDNAYLAAIQRFIHKNYNHNISIGRVRDALGKFLKLGFVTDQPAPHPDKDSGCKRPIRLFSLSAAGRHFVEASAKQGG